MLYLQYYRNPEHKFHPHAYKQAQLALRWLGGRGIPIQDEWGPPFEVQFIMMLGTGGLGNRQVPPPQTRWFCGAWEFLEFLTGQGHRLVAPLVKDFPYTLVGYEGEAAMMGAGLVSPEELRDRAA
jgi:hypothetical protein